MAAMTSSGKYVFAQGLKELRFHLCQKSEGSAALRYATLYPDWAPRVEVLRGAVHT